MKTCTGMCMQLLYDDHPHCCFLQEASGMLVISLTDMATMNIFGGCLLSFFCLVRGHCVAVFKGLLKTCTQDPSMHALLF